MIRYAPEIGRDGSGSPLISADLSIVINAPRKAGGESNAIIRGVSKNGAALRTQVRLTAGRMFTVGKREVIVSERMAARFAHMDIGDSFQTGPVTLRVVGHFTGNGSAFDSEIWMDSDEARAVFDRENYSSVLARPASEEQAEALIRRLEGDKRFKLRVVRETAYYAEQTKAAVPIRVLGGFLAVTMSVGAVFAAMNAMYATVGARTREIGTLRVLGFRRSAILAGFLVEGALLALFGGLLGCILALPLNGYATGTVSFETFSESVFAFRITPALLGQGVAFSLVVGFLGSLLPALRASRIPVISALKST